MTEVPQYQKLLTKSEKCPHCGASMKMYWQNLSKGLVSSLIKFGQEIRARNNNDIHLTDDLKLDNFEYTNFNKLKFFGLVEPSDESGRWRLTEKGMDFLANRIAVPQKVRTFRNKTKERSTQLITISDLMTEQKSEYWQSEFPFRIKESRIMPIEMEPVETAKLFF